MRYLTGALALFLTVSGVRGQDEQSKQPEPARSQGPVVERSASGVLVIRSSSAATQAARAEAAKAAEDAKKAQTGEATAAEPAAGSAEAKETPRTAPKPRARTAESYRYGPGGTRVRVSGQVTEQNTESSGQRVETIRNANGREVPYISTQERTVSTGSSGKVVERRVQRYDTEGRPAREGLIREEERKLADGSVERTTTVYEEDLNGRMRATERTVARETTSGNVTRSVVTAERAAPTGGFQTVEQKESVETRRGDSSTVETTVKRPSVSGQLTEWGRERSVTSKAGNTSTTETEVWERNTATGEVSLSQRTVGKLVEQPNGTATERIQVYGSGLPGGGASDANSGGSLRLQQTVEREVAVRSGGEKVETVTTQTRSVSSPSEMGYREVVQKVSRPTADGESVETQVQEQGVNGRLRPTQITIENIKK
jgi:hypothetical protein